VDILSWLVWLGIILFLIGLFIAITKINVTIRYHHDGDDDLLEVHMSAWRVFTYTISAPLIKVDVSSGSFIVEEDQKMGEATTSSEKGKIRFETILKDIQEFQDFVRHVAGFYRIVRRFLRRIRVHQLEWSSEIGVGDAVWTGMLLGVVWTFKGTLCGFIGNFMRLQTMPKLAVFPHYQYKVSKTKFVCMFSFRLGHAIGTGLLVLKHWKKRPSVRLFQSRESMTG
jgi:hypothetical protein